MESKERHLPLQWQSRVFYGAWIVDNGGGQPSHFPLMILAPQFAIFLEGILYTSHHVVSLSVERQVISFLSRKYISWPIQKTKSR
jgi:hypothetical protein